NEIDTGLLNNEGGAIYKYEYILDVPFDQVAGEKYWLDITAVSNDFLVPAIWRWQEAGRSTQPILCTAAESTLFTTWTPIIWPTPAPARFSDMAFVITSEEAEGCCIDGGNCLDLTPTECRANGGTPQGPGTFCTVDETCCINGGASCVDVDPLCCDDLGGTPSPLGEATCLGDSNNDGFDDACVKPGCFLRALLR
ncbi:hypothetical protein ACFL4G_10980, partial [Thermodesulfobacteriota bacterium]